VLLGGELDGSGELEELEDDGGPAAELDADGDLGAVAAVFSAVAPPREKGESRGELIGDRAFRSPFPTETDQGISWGPGSVPLLRQVRRDTLWG